MLKKINWKFRKIHITISPLIMGPIPLKIIEALCNASIQLIGPKNLYPSIPIIKDTPNIHMVLSRFVKTRL